MRIGGRTWIGAGLAVSLIFGAAAVATAGQEDAALTPAARGVTQVLTAAELAAWGRDRDDAGALIMAARLLAEVPLRQADGETPFLTATSLLDEAAAVAGDNP